MLDYPKDKLIKVKACGMGMTLIKVEALKKLRKKHKKLFATREQSLINKQTEDFHFYRLCDKEGIEVYCDTSIQCAHVDKANDFRITYKGENWDKFAIEDFHQDKI